MNKTSAKKKRNYPKGRKKPVFTKPRNTDYSQTQKVIKKSDWKIKEILTNQRELYQRKNNK